MSRPFLLRTRWLSGHILIVLLVIGMGFLSRWQFDRLAQRKAHNNDVRTALHSDPLKQIPPPSTVNWRSVELTGHFDAASTELKRYPLYQGQSGYEVITDLVTVDGEIPVDRGWIPLDAGMHLNASATNNSDPVSILAWYRHREDGSGKPGVNEGSPQIKTTTAITKPYVQLQPNHPSVPVTTSTGSVVPVTLDGPDLSEGPHWSYGLQWISFCIIAIGGWITLLYRSWREERESL